MDSVVINNLFVVRKHNHMTQQDVADILRISRSRYTLKENGQVAFKEREKRKLANHFGLSVEYLFGGMENGKDLD